MNEQKKEGKKEKERKEGRKEERKEEISILHPFNNLIINRFSK